MSRLITVANAGKRLQAHLNTSSRAKLLSAARTHTCNRSSHVHSGISIRPMPGTQSIRFQHQQSKAREVSERLQRQEEAVVSVSLNEFSNWIWRQVKVPKGELLLCSVTCSTRLM